MPQTTGDGAGASLAWPPTCCPVLALSLPCRLAVLCTPSEPCTYSWGLVRRPPLSPSLLSGCREQIGNMHARTDRVRGASALLASLQTVYQIERSRRSHSVVDRHSPGPGQTSLSPLCTVQMCSLNLILGVHMRIESNRIEGRGRQWTGWRKKHKADRAQYLLIYGRRRDRGGYEAAQWRRGRMRWLGSLALTHPCLSPPLPPSPSPPPNRPAPAIASRCVALAPPLSLEIKQRPRGSQGCLPIP